jgi:hypothetical protein
MLVRIGRVVYRVDARDDIYLYGTGLPAGAYTRPLFGST